MAKFTYTRLSSTKLLILFTHIYTHFLRICKNIHFSMINFSFAQSSHATYTIILIIGGKKLCDLFQHTILCIIVFSNNDNTQWLFLTSLSLFRVPRIENCQEVLIHYHILITINCVSLVSAHSAYLQISTVFTSIVSSQELLGTALVKVRLSPKI